MAGNVGPMFRPLSLDLLKAPGPRGALQAVTEMMRKVESGRVSGFGLRGFPNHPIASRASFPPSSRGQHCPNTRP